MFYKFLNKICEYCDDGFFNNGNNHCCNCHQNSVPCCIGVVGPRGPRSEERRVGKEC